MESKQKSTAAGADAPKTIVEHTAINPNKAAHIGHLRNAVLGDTFVRLLRHAGRNVEIQNYIDNTGVQVADVVLGFLHLEKKSIDDVLASHPRAAIRLRLLGSLHPRHAISRRRQIASRTPRPHSQGNRRRPGRSRANGRTGFNGHRPPPSRNTRPARNRLRPANTGKRNSAPEILGRRLRHAEEKRRDSDVNKPEKPQAAG